MLDHHSIIPLPSIYRKLPQLYPVPSTLTLRPCDASLPIAQLLYDALNDLELAATIHNRSAYNAHERAEVLPPHITLSICPLSALPLLKEAAGDAADPHCLEHGYELQMTMSGIVLQAPTAHGLLHGVHSLLQLLLPASPVLQRDTPPAAALPCVAIADLPRFRWRGLLLDVGRYFYSVDFIKRVLDVMALYKMTHFHWHLTEDQVLRLVGDTYMLLCDMRVVLSISTGMAPGDPALPTAHQQGCLAATGRRRQRHCRLWRLLHAGRGAGGGGVCSSARHRDGAGDRDAWTLLRGIGVLSPPIMYAATRHFTQSTTLFHAC